MGTKRKLPPEDYAKIAGWIERREFSAIQIARLYNTSRQAVYKYLKTQKLAGSS